MYKIINSDNIELDLSNASKVDAIITDPPYLISKKGAKCGFNRSKSNDTLPSYFDFGDFDYEFDIDKFVGKYAEILKDGGAFIMFTSDRIISDIIRAYEKYGVEYKNTIYIHKTNPMPRNMKRRYLPAFEIAVYGVKGSGWTYNLEDGEKYAHSYYRASVQSSKKIGHPTPKDVKMVQQIVRRHTNEGDVVIDPFMGSGAIGVACLNEGRHYIGVELEEKYCKIAERRLENETDK